MLRDGCALALFCLLLAEFRLPAADAAAAMQPQAESAPYDMLSSEQMEPVRLPAASNAYMLPARTQVVPGLAGVKRVLLGFVLMAAALIHFSQVTYHKIMPLPERAFQHVIEAGARIIGEQAPNRVDYALDRYAEYAKRHPEIVGAELGGLFIGFALFLSGVFALGRPRKIKHINQANGFL